MLKKRSFLKWAGSKYRCLEKILQTLPDATRLVEPFTGSGVVFLNTNYHRYLLAENNTDLIALFSCIKTEGLSFIDDCEKLFISKNNDADAYYAYRAEFNESLCERRRALLFVYLNRHGFNGLCRYNRSGKYNVPFGRYVAPYFPKKEMLYFHEKSEGAKFQKADFRKTLLETSPGDVIYCDPPYVPLSNSASFSSYTSQPFGEIEQLALVELAIACSKRGIPVIISNHDTPLTREYYKEANIISFPVRRHISCLAAKRGIVSELIAIF